MKACLGRGLYGMVDLSSTKPAVTPRSLYQPLWAAGVTVLQLRMKEASAAAMLAVLDEILANKPAGTQVLVNDRLDVALAAGADGAHLGQDDLPLAAARRICAQHAKPGFVLGISTHNEAQAQAAIAGGADYIALGPIFQTGSKLNPDPVVGIDRLRHVCQLSPVPVIAIGGISIDLVPAVVTAGAHGVAIIAAVNQAPDVREAAQAVQRCFAQNR